MLKAIRTLLLCASAFGAFSGFAAHADELEDLPPYKMLRSLQHIQDSIVLGDHSAAEMQRFMLAAIDKRLREADPSVFDDPRNVDAAFIYAMSGGNPETLSYLANHDIEGNFDSRIIDALNHYLAGKGGLMVGYLEKAIPEYRNSRVGPYLYLVLGNATAMQNPANSLKYYDWARLTSPGTNIEEAALRRSIALATRGAMPDKGFTYSLSYARRFLTSPYASQFADVFVELAVANYSDQTEAKIQEILSFMDKPRQREVYLRIARRAAIGGMQALAKLASDRAGELSDGTDAGPKALASLYSGLVGIPSKGILEAVKDISAIPEAELSPRDRALRQAATVVAEEVLRAPDPESLTQATDSKVVPENVNMTGENGAETGSGDSPFAVPASGVAENAAQPEPEQQVASSENNPPDPVLDAFLTNGRTKLDEIDSLLKGDEDK
ncbi:MULTISPECIES: chemotaxis protein MotC [unclassified Rhizobium]|uniref:chemotaxis protein MotC n=1 Tax=unclassified Rhizobium TaxID=2613769 RepID=UPI000712F006|nr:MULTISPECIES: chemotaxis protein MotC [unclassified Rhizobium]KQS90939.1 chemotaxis protein [Rhizobium sp. Leaf391]KQS96027.1 chemotaxis protein [Rhizobium sp. Leaf386]KQU09898.1 chemotaxis protein [Rhizobium sp. Leaf453]